MQLRTRNGRLAMVLGALLAVALANPGAVANAQQAGRPFAIQVVDESTGRGIPLVELETIHHVTFVTDSAGLAAIAEPELMHQDVHFTIRSHGYESPTDGFGINGRTVRVEPGGETTIKLKRLNLAERLYRVTGAGIYRDSYLLGRKTPIEHPLMHGQVLGCDSVMVVPYRDKLYWFWGDTSRPSHPLGANFHITGATSQLPAGGGPSPAAGVNFQYFLDPAGAVRATAKMPGQGPTWISSPTVLKDDQGRERLYAAYVKIRNQLESYRWGFVVWNDETQQFDALCQFDRRPAIFLEPQAHTFLHRDTDGTQYVYFANPLPLTRVQATSEAFIDPAQYEGFTCLAEGTRAEDGQVQRDSAGHLRYAWRKNTPPLSEQDRKRLVDRGLIKPDEAPWLLRDIQSGRSVQPHSGSVYWNAYRNRWVLIVVELGGTSSLLGEVWYAQADTPTGPWLYARKIVTHDQYSFYNPKHHPYFDEDGGRIIYFEGTYTHTFSGNNRPTPRYDYNQVMYRLDLSQPELNLPVAFYDVGAAEDQPPFAARQPGRPVAFFAKERPGPGMVAITWDGAALKTAADDQAAVFYALAADDEAEAAHTTPLYEFIHEQSGRRIYSTTPTIEQPGFRRTDKPVCRVWKK